MQLIFHPMRSDAALELVRDGDRLTVNGEIFDFSPLPEGAALPRAAVAAAWLAGEIRREDGILRIPVILPLGPDAPQAARFAPALTLAGDGPVSLPGAGAAVLPPAVPARRRRAVAARAAPAPAAKNGTADGAARDEH